MAVKPPTLLHKMSVTHQKAWYKKNDPENMPAHLSTSVAKSKSATPDRVKAKAREKLSLKAYGATKGKATGGEGGNSEAPPKDTIAPLTRDQHSAVQSAKRTSEAPKAAKAEKPKAAPAAKPVDRLALIRAAAKKSQSAAGKMKRAAKFDVPTEDPDDNTHDDYVSQHYGMHHYKEESESIDESGNDWVHDLVARAKARNPNANIKVTTGAEKKKETEEMLKKRAAERAKNPQKAVYTRSPGSEKYDLHGIGKDPISGRSYNEEVEQVDELSRGLLNRYKKAATDQRSAILDKPQYRSKVGKGTHIDPRSGEIEHNLLPGKPLSKKDDRITDKRYYGAELAKQKLSRTSKQVKVKADNEPTLSNKRQASFKFEEVEQIEEGKMKSALPDSGDKGDDDYEATLHHVVRQAKGIAFGKRYKSGNMTGAHVAISKLGKKYGIGNLENHPEVKAMLQKANEQYETDAIRMTKAIAAARPETNAGPKDISSPEKKRTMSHDKLSSIATAAKRKLMSTDPLNPNKQMGEEVEQVEEATMKDDYKSYSGKGNDKPGWMLRADPQLAAKFKEKAKAAALRKKYMGKTSDEIAAMRKEEVEQIEEARVNHRDFATDGVMHPSMANASYMKRGETADFYSSKNGDKLQGKVVKNDGKNVHIMQGKDVHKFRVSATAPHQMQNEEAGYIEERLTKNDPPSKWIHDFVASDNPKFAGKSKKERIDMALGAYYGKKRGV